MGERAKQVAKSHFGRIVHWASKFNRQKKRHKHWAAAFGHGKTQNADNGQC
jgi:hypothetical protein